MIYLYVKTHNKTGLKYLGKTAQDPNIYRGSGKRWKNHIQKHGYDVRTEIIFTSESKEDITEKGIYYSNLWDVVNSNEWANIREETGDGGDTSQFIDYNKIPTHENFINAGKRDKRGENNPNYGNKWSEEQKQALSSKLSDGRRAGKNNAAYGVKRSDLTERNKAGIGKHWYTDGVVSKQYFPHEVPIGWAKGRVTYKE